MVLFIERRRTPGSSKGMFSPMAYQALRFEDSNALLEIPSGFCSDEAQA